MFFNSYDFKMLEAGTNLAWVQQELHMQNMANIETPGYKAKSLVFEDFLKRETHNRSMSSGDMIESKIVSDDAVSNRPDGNNVNVEIEGIELYKSYAQYSLLLDKVKGQFNSYSTVLNNNMR